MSETLGSFGGRFHLLERSSMLGAVGQEVVMSVDHVAVRQESHYASSFFTFSFATSHAIIQPLITILTSTDHHHKFKHSTNVIITCTHDQHDYNDIRTQVLSSRSKTARHNYDNNTTTTTTQLQLQPPLMSKTKIIFTHKCLLFTFQDCRAGEKPRHSLPSDIPRPPQASKQKMYIWSKLWPIKERRKDKIYLGAVYTCHRGGCC